MFQAEIPAGICRYKENEKGETQHCYYCHCVSAHFLVGKNNRYVGLTSHVLHNVTALSNEE